MSLVSHAYKRLCRLYRGVLQHMRQLQWLMERGLRWIDAPPEPATAVTESFEPRLLLSSVFVETPDANGDEVSRDHGSFNVVRDVSAGALDVNYQIGGTAGSGDYTLSVLDSANTIQFQEHSVPTYTVHDVMLSEESPAANFGGICDFVVGRSGPNLARSRALLGFDLSELYSQLSDGQRIRIDSATLTFTHGGTARGNLGGSGESIELQMLSYTNSFDEMTATWASTGSDGAAHLGTLLGKLSIDPTVTGTYPANHESRSFVSSGQDAFTDAVATAVGATDHTFRVILVSPQAEAGTLANAVRIVSSDSTQFTGQDVRPKLTLSYSILSDPQSGVLHFADGVGSLTVEIEPVDDSEAEGNETVGMALTAGSGYTVVAPPSVPGYSAVTIQDNPAPDVSVTVPTAQIAEAGTQTGTFVITRSRTSGSLRVFYTISGDATSGQDYSALAGYVDFQDGQASADVIVAPINDVVIESPEKVVLTLKADPSYKIAGATAGGEITITSEDIPTVTIQATDASAAENNQSPATITVTRNGEGASNGDLVVNYSLGGTAGSGDYVAQVPVSGGVASYQEATGYNVQDGAAREDQPGRNLQIVREDYVVGRIGPDLGRSRTVLGFDISGLRNLAGVGQTLRIDSVSLTFVQGGTTNGLTGGMGESVWLQLQSFIPFNENTLTWSSADFDAHLGAVLSNLTNIDPTQPGLYPNNNRAETFASTEAFRNAIVSALAGDGVFWGMLLAPVVEDEKLRDFVRIASSESTHFGVAARPQLKIAYSILENDLARNSVVIPDGHQSVAITITPVDDGTSEPDETVSLTLQNGGYINGSSTPAVATIVDVEPPMVTITADKAVVNEGENATITITRKGPLTNALSVHFEVPENFPVGSQYAGAGDFVLTPEHGIIDIPAGADHVHVDLQAVDDSLIELDESLNIWLEPSSSYIIQGAETLHFTIHSDDVPTVTVTGENLNLAEGSSQTATLTVTRSGDGLLTDSDLVVQYGITGTAGPADHVDNLQIGAVTVDMRQGIGYNVQDAMLRADKPDTNFSSNIQDYIVGRNAGSASRVMLGFDFSALFDSLLPGQTITIENALLTFTHGGTLQGNSGGAGGIVPLKLVSYGFDFDEKEATWNTPGEGLSGPQPYGQTLAAIDVNPKVPGTYPNNHQTLTFAHTADFDEYVETSIMTGDHVMRTMFVAPSVESGTGSNYVRILSSEHTQFGLNCRPTLSLSYTVWSNTMSGTVLIPAGQTSATITIGAVDDTISEGDQSMQVALSAPQDGRYAVGAPSSVSVNIADNEVPVTVVATESEAQETGPETGIFTITRAGPTGTALVVNYTLTGTATNSDDYSFLSGTAVIPAGESSVTITITPTDDGRLEAAETVVLTLFQNECSPNQATVTILDSIPVAVCIQTDTAAISAVEGETVTNTGRWASPSGSVTIDASIGYVTTNADGTWSWSFDTAEAPPDLNEVTLTAGDDSGGSSTVTFALNLRRAPQVTTNASAVLTTDKTQATLSVIGSDDGGEELVTYRWSVCASSPDSLPAVTFSENGTNAAKNSVATFGAPGYYLLKVTLTDADGLAVDSFVEVVVPQVVATIHIAPSDVTLELAQDQDFVATCLDQFGRPVAEPEGLSWSVASGVGSFTDSSVGHYDAGTSVGTATVQVTLPGGPFATATVHVNNAAPVITAGPTASWNSQHLWADLAVAASDSGLAPLQYHWQLVQGNPSLVTIQDEDKAQARAVFSGAGIFKFIVTVSDGYSSVDSSEVALTVDAVPQSVSISGPATATMGDTTTFTAAATYAGGTPSTLRYAWSVTREGLAYDLPVEVPTGGNTLTFTPRESGNYAVSVSVWSDSGAAMASVPWSMAVEASDAVPQVTGLHLDVDTGSIGDGITTNPDLAGTIVSAGSVNYLPVQFDLNGDGTPDGVGFTSGNGSGEFVLHLEAYVNTPGEVHASVRAGRADTTTGSYVYGDWSQITFTFEQAKDGEPLPSVPQEASEATLPSASWSPVFTGSDGASASTYGIDMNFPGVFARFGSRFHPAGDQSYDFSDIYGERTSTNTYSDQYGTYEITVTDSKNHTIDCDVNGDGTWAFSEFYDFDWLKVTHFEGFDGSIWDLTEVDNDAYELISSGSSSGSNYFATEDRDHSDVFDWKNQETSPLHTYHSEQSEKLLLTLASGTDTIVGGVHTISENILLEAYGDGKLNNDQKGQNAEVTWQDTVGDTSSWHFKNTTSPLTGDAGSKSVYESGYDSTHTVTSRHNPINVATCDEQLSYDHASSVSRTVNGWTETLQNGSSTGSNVIHYVDKVTKDIYDQIIDRDSTANESSGGIQYENKSSLDAHSHRERTRLADNTGTTTLVDGKAVSYSLLTVATNDLSSWWNSTESAYAKCTDSTEPGTKIVTQSNQWSYSDGTLKYDMDSSGTREVDGSGVSKIVGSTTIVQDSTGSQKWDNSDSSSLDRHTTVSVGSGITVQTDATGTSSLTDKGDGSFTAHSDGKMESDAAGNVTKTGNSRHDGLMTSNRTSDTNYTVAVVTTDKSQANVTSTRTETSSSTTHSEGQVVTTVTGLTSESAIEHLSSESLTQTDKGSSSSYSSETNTLVVEDTNVAGLITNSTSTATSTRDAKGSYSSSLSDVTTIDEGAVTKTFLNEGESSGTLAAKDSSSGQSTVVDKTIDGLVITTEVTTEHLSDRPAGTYWAKFSYKSDTIPLTTPVSTGHEESHEEGNSTVTSETHVTVTTDDTRSDIVTQSIVQTDETYEGKGTVTSDSVADDKTINGVYSSTSTSGTTSDDTGSTTYYSKSSTTASGKRTLSPGITEEQGGDGGPNTDEYVENRTGASHSIETTGQSTVVIGGSVTSSSSRAKTWTDTGTTSWTRKLHNVVEIIDKSKAGIYSSQKNTTDITDSKGSGKYSTIMTSGDNSYADGTWSSYETSDEKTIDGINYSKTVADTVSEYKDTTVKGITKTTNTATHTEEEEDTSRTTTGGFANKRNPDGTTSSTSYATEEIEGSLDENQKAGTSTSTYDAISTTTYAQEDLSGQYKYYDANDQEAFLTIVHKVIGTDTIVEHRTQDSSYTLYSKSTSASTDGKNTASDYYHRVDTGSYTSDSKTNLPEGGGEAHGIEVTETAGGVDGKNLVLARTSTLKHTEHTYTVQDENGKDPSVTHDTIRSSDLLADGTRTSYDYDKTTESAKMKTESETKRTGWAWERISIRRDAYRVTDKDDSTAKSENTSTFSSSVEVTTNLLADGKTTSRTVDKETTNSTGTSESTVDTQSHMQDKEIQSKDSWLAIFSTFARHNTAKVTEGKAYSDSTHTVEVAADGKVTDTLNSVTGHDNKIANTTDEVTQSTKTRKYPVTRPEDWYTKITRVASETGIDKAEDRVNSLAGGGTQWSGSSEYSVTGSFTDETTSTHNLSFQNKSFLTDSRRGWVTSKSSSYSKDTTTADGTDTLESYSLVKSYTRTSDGKHTDESTETKRDKSKTDGLTTETTTSTSVGSMGTNSNVHFTGSTSSSSTNTTHASRDNTATTSKTETETGWTSTVHTVTSETGDSTWNSSSSDQVLGDNTNEPEFSDTTDTSSDNGSGNYSSSSNWTDTSKSDGSTTHEGTGTSHADTKGKSNKSHIESKWRATTTETDAREGVTRRGGGTTDIDKTETDYSSNGDVTRTAVAGGAETYAGSASSHIVSKRTVSTLHTIHYKYDWTDKADKKNYSHVTMEDAWGTSTITEKDVTLTSTLKADGTTTDTSNDTTTVTTADTSRQYMFSDSCGLVPGEPGYYETDREELETVYHDGSGDFGYVTTVNGKLTDTGGQVFQSYERSYYISDGPMARDIYWAGSEKKKIPAGATVGNVTLECTVEGWDPYDGSLLYSDHLDAKFTQGANETVLTAIDPNGASSLKCVMYDGYLDEETTIEESPISSLDSDPYAYIISLGMEAYYWGPYPNLLVHNIGEQLVEWTFHSTGIDLIKAYDEAVTAAEILADGFFGAVDGFLDTINPVNKWWSIPDIGPVFGHETAYAVGQVVGTVAGVVTSMAIGNAAAGACGIVALAAKAYTFVDTVAGMVGAAQNIYEGKGGLLDALAFAPVLSFGFQRLRGVTNQCFTAGTEVLSGSADDPSVMEGKDIQDLQVGDLVWTRPDGDADAALVLKPVTAVTVNVAYELVQLSVSDEAGNVETFSTTTEHPFYSATRGWTPSIDLQVGEDVLSADGKLLHVTFVAIKSCPEGVATYNFTVEDGHTYFVSDGLGQDSWAWVHNSCSSRLGKDLLDADPKYTRQAGDQAAHVIPSGSFSNRPLDVQQAVERAQKKFDKLVGDMRNRALNGFFTQCRRHKGTHTNAYLREMGRKMDQADTAEEVIAVVEELKARALKGDFL